MMETEKSQGRLAAEAIVATGNEPMKIGVLTR
jgi:hypothetical protein